MSDASSVTPIFANEAEHQAALAAIFSAVRDPSTPTLADISAPIDATSHDEISALPLEWQDTILAAGQEAYAAALRAHRTPEEAMATMADVMTRKLDQLVESESRKRFGHLPEEAQKAIGIAPTPKSTGYRGVEICEAGLARSAADVAALTEAGFVMQEPLFDRGTMVLGSGVDNARASRAEYEALPLVRDVCASLTKRVLAEQRRTVDVQARDVSMTLAGRVVLGAHGEHAVGEHGFSGLVERLGYGGAAYLSKCPPVLRAHNVYAQRDLLTEGEDKAIAAAIDKRWSDARAKAEPRRLAARVRGPEKNPEIFAVVSPGYPTFDADQIAQAFAQAMPPDARGTVRYDPGSTGARFEALFQSTVAPEHFVAGEVFRTGIRVRSSDAGDGAIVVRAIAFQNLCLNLIVIDKATREIARIRHVGSVDKLRAEFVKAMAKAKGAISPFLKQWGYACEEDIVATLRADGVKIPTKHDEIMRGVFASVLASRRVRFPRIAGKGREGVVDDLVAAWRKDVSSATAKHAGITRAAVVNAITRAAQGWLNSLDPWASDAIEIDAAKLLWGSSGERPAPLGFLDKIAEETEIVMSTAGRTA
jgi:hypothetical protein